MRIIPTLLLAFSLFAVRPAFAAETCACDHACEQDCAQGKGEKCQCDCGCKEGKGCQHGKCSH